MALYHYGIKGMRWGIRRYQNEDGSYTSAGKKRYLSDKTEKIQRDIDSYKPFTKTGIRTKSGQMVLTPDEIKRSMSSLYEIKKKKEEKYGKKWDEKASEQALKDARKKEIKKNVSDYNKKYGEATREAERADAQWEVVKEKRMAMGKTKVGRLISAIKGTSKESKEYSKAYDEWVKIATSADEKHAAMREAYEKTGRNRISRVLNNIKYG